MKYINQLEYFNIPYETDLKHVGESDHFHGTIATSGCGICCAMMVVDALCTCETDLQSFRDDAYCCQANEDPGTDMKLYGPYIAGKYGLIMTASDDIEQMKYCLQNGGQVIINVGGDRNGHIGIFSHGGHYILAKSFKDGKFCILDPSLKEGKFEEEGRKGKVMLDGVFCFTDPEVILADTAKRSPAFYCFERRVPSCVITK